PWRKARASPRRGSGADTVAEQGSDQVPPESERRQMPEQGSPRPGAPSATDPSAWLEYALRTGPDRTFIETSQGRRFTYGELEKLSAELMSVLARSGVSAGDRV